MARREQVLAGVPVVGDVLPSSHLLPYRVDDPDRAVGQKQPPPGTFRFKPIGRLEHLRHKHVDLLQVRTAIAATGVLEAESLDLTPLGLPRVDTRAVATAQQLLARLYRLRRLVLLTHSLPSLLLAQSPDRVIIHLDAQDAL